MAHEFTERTHWSIARHDFLVVLPDLETCGRCGDPAPGLLPSISHRHCPGLTKRPFTCFTRAHCPRRAAHSIQHVRPGCSLGIEHDVPKMCKVTYCAACVSSICPGRPISSSWPVLQCVHTKTRPPSVLVDRTRSIARETPELSHTARQCPKAQQVYHASPRGAARSPQCSSRSSAAHSTSKELRLRVFLVRCTMQVLIAYNA